MRYAHAQASLGQILVLCVVCTRPETHGSTEARRHGSTTKDNTNKHTKIKVHSTPPEGAKGGGSASLRPPPSAMADTHCYLHAGTRQLLPLQLRNQASATAGFLGNSPGCRPPATDTYAKLRRQSVRASEQMYRWLPHEQVLLSPPLPAVPTRAAPPTRLASDAKTEKACPSPSPVPRDGSDIPRPATWMDHQVQTNLRAFWAQRSSGPWHERPSRLPDPAAGGQSGGRRQRPHLSRCATRTHRPAWARF